MHTGRACPSHQAYDCSIDYARAMHTGRACPSHSGTTIVRSIMHEPCIRVGLVLATQALGSFDSIMHEPYTGRACPPQAPTRIFTIYLGHLGKTPRKVKFNLNFLYFSTLGMA